MSRTGLSPLITDLLKKHHLLTVPQLLEKLTKKGHSYNKTSVYRALDVLLEKNEVCRQSFGENDIVYELRGDHHDHAVCTNCGDVKTLECSVSQLTDLGDFQPDHHHLTVFGLCSNCAGGG